MNIVVIGAQWGDEGKGKIVDYIADQAENTIRFSGGANAGHTIVTGGKTFKLHLVPSGITYPGKTVVLGSGMVIDLEGFFKEIDDIEKQGVNCQGRIYVSDRAHIVFPSYKQEDMALEKQRRYPIGTTGRGIGVAYSKKSSRDGVRIGDLFDSRVEKVLSQEELEFVNQYKERLKPMVINLASFMAKQKGKANLFEGAQGVLLDLDSGTYPYVSSGMSAAAGASLGGGIGPRAIDKIIGVTKAYTTRVGNGPFPSEFTQERDGEMGKYIRDTGKEYGATTGRPRRCGYLDLVALKYVCQSNSIDTLVMTKLDIYDKLEEIKACVAYQIDGREIDYFPASIEELEKAEPVLKSFPGWQKDLSGCRSYDNLPGQVKDYLSFVQDFLETPIDILSVGPQREQTFYRKAPWTKY